MNDQDAKDGISGLTCHQEGDDDTLGMLGLLHPSRCVFDNMSVIRFLFMFEAHITLSKPHHLHHTHTRDQFNGDIPSTDNGHPLRLLLQIEQAIRVDAKQRP